MSKRKQAKIEIKESSKSIIENKILPGDKIELLPGVKKDEYNWKKN